MATLEIAETRIDEMQRRRSAGSRSAGAGTCSCRMSFLPLVAIA